MSAKLGKKLTGISMIFSILATTANSASSNMNGFEDCRRASTDELNGMRGGFLINANGMQMLLSLGIERITYVNGVLVAMSTFNLLPQLNSSQLRQALSSQLSAANLQQVPSATQPVTADIGPTAPAVPATMSVAPGSSPAPTSATVVPSIPAPSVAPVASISSPTPSTPPATPRMENNQSIQVVQIGPGNTFTQPSVANLTAGTMAVIQNTLDNQVIRNMTIINATLANRELIRSMAINAVMSRMPNFSR